MHENKQLTHRGSICKDPQSSVVRDGGWEAAILKRETVGVTVSELKGIVAGQPRMDGNTQGTGVCETLGLKRDVWEDASGTLSQNVAG